MKSTIAEKNRLKEEREGIKKWKKWGPYLSDRQWGTVREDYSDHGNAWMYFTHDQARSRAYKWGEDGLGGISDDQQKLCFGLALWNHKDPIIKERLFGLANNEGNHGEDVKECYFYLDNTPSHSYMKFLYKYPQEEFPYDELVRVNGERGKNDREYELLDTGIFEDNHYFDVFIEYAKAETDDILIKITICNRSSEFAPLSVLPSLWFRNAWEKADDKFFVLKEVTQQGNKVIQASDLSAKENAYIDDAFLHCYGDCELLFTNNETNNELLFNTANDSPFVKDGINNYIVQGDEEAVNPEKTRYESSSVLSG